MRGSWKRWTAFRASSRQGDDSRPQSSWQTYRVKTPGSLAVVLRSKASSFLVVRSGCARDVKQGKMAQATDGGCASPQPNYLTRYQWLRPMQGAPRGAFCVCNTEQHILQRFQTLTPSPDSSVQHPCDTEMVGCSRDVLDFENLKLVMAARLPGTAQRCPRPMGPCQLPDPLPTEATRPLSCRQATDRPLTTTGPPVQR